MGGKQAEAGCPDGSFDRPPQAGQKRRRKVAWEGSPMNWGHLSKYRSELMGVAILWVMAFHNICKWPVSLGWLKLLERF